MIELTTIGGHLIFFGVLLFVAGLVQGVCIPFVKNSRMALSGHLTAVQCGMALAIFGLIWALVDLSPLWSNFAAYGSMAGYSLIWLGITMASLTGASQALPIAGKGYEGTLVSERTVKCLEICGVALSLISGITLVVGLSGLVIDA